MVPELTKYKISIECGYSEWWRYNVYVMMVGYDSQGSRMTYDTLQDHVYDIEYDSSLRTSPPAGYQTPRVIELTGMPCHHAEVYVYVVANTFPSSAVIGDSPPFDITLKAGADGRVLEASVFQVNQWGGLTIVAHKLDVRG